MGKKKFATQHEVTLDMIHYTDESYFRCYPNATDEDYIQYVLTDLKATVRAMEKQHHMRVKAIRNVIIDEHYFTWLEENGYENTTENRLKYGGTLSDEDVVDLWRANNREEVILPYTLQFIVFSGENILPVANTSINTPQLNQLKTLLAKTMRLPKEQLFVHAELLRADVCADEAFEEAFEEAAEAYFAGNPKVRMQKAKFIGKQTDQTLIQRFLPFAVRDIEPAIQTRKEFDAKTWIEHDLPEQALKKWGEDIFKKQGAVMVSALPEYVAFDEIETVVEEFHETFVQQAKENGLVVNNAK